MTEQTLLTPEQEKETLEARWKTLLALEKKLSEWAILSSEEQKKMNSLLRAIRKYADYLDEIN